MPARAIKLLKDPRWRAIPLYTLLSLAGKKDPPSVGTAERRGCLSCRPREGGMSGERGLTQRVVDRDRKGGQRRTPGTQLEALEDI